MVYEQITPIQRFWRLLKPDKREISNVYVYAIFNGLINLSLPLGIQAIINLIQGGQISTSWIILVLFVILGVAITGVLQILQLRITENLQQKIFTRAAFEFAYRIPKVRLEAIYKHYAPELMNRFFDTLPVQKGLSKILVDFSTATLQVVFGLVLLSLYHPFFLVFSVALVLLVFAIFRFTAQRGLNTSLQESKYKYQVAHWLEELARTSITFKLAGNTDLALQQTNANVGHYLRARESHFKVLVQQYWLLVIFKVLVTTGLLAIGGVLVMEQQMNIGQFVGAEIVILLVMASVEKLILSMETIYDVLTALEKIGQVTDIELEKNDGLDLSEQCPDGGLSVQLENIVFCYPGQSQKMLNGLSLNIQSGEKVLVTGPNGSGKSTLLYILAGLYDVQEGFVSYNALPKGNLKLDTLRAVIGDFMAQEQLFEGTILDNITMRREQATFEQAQWAVKQVGLSDFIRQMPKGFDTLLDPEGKRLPNSTVQKLLLARSIAAKPKLLLLNHDFQQLDQSERYKIIDFLTDRTNSWTLVAISSDPYFVKRANRVIVLENGKIVNQGNNKN